MWGIDMEEGEFWGLKSTDAIADSGGLAGIAQSVNDISRYFKIRNNRAQLRTHHRPPHTAAAAAVVVPPPPPPLPHHQHHHHHRRRRRRRHHSNILANHHLVET